MKLPLLPDEIEINGVRLSGIALVQIISTITYPDPDRWYKFERKGNDVLVTVKYDEKPVEQPA